MKGRHVLGKLSRNCDTSAPRNCEAVLTWELRDRDGKREFAACGEVWNHLKTDIVQGGQCVAELAALFPHDKKAQRIAAVHAAWHLNGMNSGTPEQEAALADCTSHDHTARCAHLEAKGLLSVPVTDELRASALGGLPEGATSYTYGACWLYRPLPADVIALIENGFGPSEQPEPEPDPDLLDVHGITVKAVFVPFSQSRNRTNKEPSLNWRVTLQVKGRDVLTTDYSAGSAHCPAYGKKWKYPGDKRQAIKAECEQGEAMRAGFGGNPWTTKTPILPDTRDVVRSLLLDAAVIDAGGFEAWACEYGFDSDSITARDTYNTCLEHALALRGALGSTVFDELMEANQ